MASQTQGIQQLLAAEKKATDKVNEAKKRKALRLKTAKKEADAEIQAYKTEKEKTYKEFEESILGSRSENQAQMQKITDQKLLEMTANFKKNKGTSIKSILDVVNKIDIELHENLKL